MERTYDDRQFRDTFEHEFTWLNGFLRNVVRYGNELAMIDPDTERMWTYRDLNAEANRLAHALAADGIGKNDVVTTALMNTPEFAFCYIGPRKIGAILNPANFNLAPGELALLIDHNKPKALIYSAHVSEMVVEALSLSHHKPTRLIMADNLKHKPVPTGHMSYESYTGTQPTDNPVMNYRPHIYDEVLRLCTSGTTALPKSVPLNDINDLLTAHDVIMQYPMERHDVTMNMTPWFHRGGCHCGGPGPAFYLGASVVVLRRFHPKTVLEYVERYGITYLMGAPSTLEMLYRTQMKTPFNLTGLHGLVTMGAPLEKEACERYLSTLTPNIFNGYGTTETFWNSFLRPYDLPDYAGSIGGSCIDDDVRLVKVYPDHKAEPDDEVETDNETVGEIIIWSPAKCTYSYFHNDQDAHEKFYKGWMYTGDLGTWDEHRYITTYGRKDDMIVTAAENVYPSQLEEVLNSCEFVADSMVTSIPDEKRGESIVAYIVAADPSVRLEDVIAYCATSPMISAYKRPRFYRFVDELPRTATGKKMHYVIKERAIADAKAGRLLRGQIRYESKAEQSLRKGAQKPTDIRRGR